MKPPSIQRWLLLLAAGLTLPVLATTQDQNAAKDEHDALTPIIEPTGGPVLKPAGPYVMKDNVFEIELSEWSGYTGIILANGGLEPSEDSIFFANYGFKVKIALADRENLDPVHTGEVGGWGATVDQLAVYGKPLDVVTPVMFDYSRGSDHVVLRKGYKTLRDCVGKVLVSARFSESDFFLRYLASNNGLEIHELKSIDDTPKASALNCVYTRGPDAATQVFVQDMKAAKSKLVGCVSRAPSSIEAAERSKGKAYINSSNANQLIVADVLAINKAFALANPKIVKGLTHGIIEGNRRVIAGLKTDDTKMFELLAKALTTDNEEPWTADNVKVELGNIELANFALNKAFFTDTLELGGSYQGIFEEAVKAYGSLVTAPTSADRFLDLKPLDELLTEVPAFASDQVTIKEFSGPKPSRTLAVWRDLDFIFERNIYDRVPLDLGENKESLDQIARYVKFAPGSRIQLTGHLDDSEAKRRGQAWATKYAANARKASLKRADSVKNTLVTRFGLLDSQITTLGRGWDFPLGEALQNRRVEVRIFTLE
jgi:NitT/TauT family transport system substrate-binding protein